MAATAIGSLAMSSQAQLQRLLGEYVQRRTWGSILDVSTSVGLESFEDPDFFDDLQRARTNAIIQPLTLAQGLVELVGGLFGVVGLSIAVVVIDPVLLPLILIGGLPLFLISRRQGHIEFAFNVTQTPALRVRHYMTEVLTGRNEAKEVRAFGLGGFLRGRWASLYDTYIEDFRVHVRRRLLLAALGSLVTIVVTSVTFGLLVYLVLDDRISLASAGAAFIAIRLLATQIGELFNGVSGLFESSLFLRDLDRFLERRPPPEPDDAAVGSPDAVRPFSALRAEGLRFRYPGGQHDVLKGIDLTINAGEVVALVGENGSGKTTLAKLLGQLYEATGGRILWDGRDTRELPRTALRAPDRADLPGLHPLPADRAREHRPRTGRGDRRRGATRGRGGARRRRPLHRRPARGLRDHPRQGVRRRLGPLSRPVAAHRPGAGLLPRRAVPRARRAHRVARPPLGERPVRARALAGRRPGDPAHLASLLDGQVRRSHLRDPRGRADRVGHARGADGRRAALRRAVHDAGRGLPLMPVRALRPAALPPAGRVGIRHRARVTLEILVAYVPLSRHLRANDLTRMVAEARAPDRPRRPVPESEHAALARRLGFMVEKVLARLPTDDRCLIRSLVLLRMLHDRGISAELVLGVRSQGAFGAHAWVEHEGEAVLPHGNFARLTTF